jgi:hypothetical protein
MRKSLPESGRRRINTHQFISLPDFVKSFVSTKSSAQYNVMGVMVIVAMFLAIRSTIFHGSSRVGGRESGFPGENAPACAKLNVGSNR